MPRLPEPPPDEVITGVDGRVHRFRFRISRAPTGVVAEAEELEVPQGEGYRVEIMGAHDLDPGLLLESLRQRMWAEVARVQLEPHPHRPGWIANGDEIEGRLEWNPAGEFGKPYDVIVDGRRLTWEELGHALEPFERWRFRLSIVETDLVPTAEGGRMAEVVPLRGQGEDMASDDDLGAGYDDDLEGEEEFLEALDEAEERAVELLRAALPELIDHDLPRGPLEAAAAALRAGMKEHRWPHDHMRRAAGFEKLPENDPELWVGAAGGLISMREESGLNIEEDATIMALEQADWLGAVVGLVRGGPGASAEPEVLVGYINSCPEVEGEVDPDEDSLVEGAFELVLPAWEAAGAIDSNRRLTPLGRWGLPRALAWAWNGDFDSPARP
jgi:hypothetical protein